MMHATAPQHDSDPNGTAGYVVWYPHRDSTHARIWETCQDETAINLRRAFSRRYPVNCMAVRYKRHGSLANRNRHHQPATQHHGPGTEAGGKATPGGAGGKATKVGAAGGKQGRSPRNIASRSNGTDKHSKAGGRFSDGADCRAREDLEQLHRWLPNKLQIRQPAVERMLRVVRGFYFIDNVQKRTQLQDLFGVQGDRNVFGLEATRSLVVLQQPVRLAQAFRREASGRRTQTIKTSLIPTKGRLATVLR